MRLSLSHNIPLGLAIIAPLIEIFAPIIFMAVVALGLWDPLSQLSELRAFESIGWTAILALGAEFAVLHFALSVFFILHIITNRSAPIFLRIAFAAGLLIVPPAVLAGYFLLYSLPDAPSPWV